MKINEAFLCEVPLFQGVSPGDLSGMLNCLKARIDLFHKQDIVILEGQAVSEVGIVLSGSIHILKEDFLGNRNILAEVGEGDLFAESYACAHVGHSPVTAVSVANSEVLWIDYRHIITTCASACPFHLRLVENMLSILASKNILLNQKMDYLSKRTTREKLLSYLSDLSRRRGTRDFTIPFNRQELADYLCVDRSAMSGELSKMQREGILKYHLNRFVLSEEDPTH